MDDVYCPICGEPTSLFYFHEVAEEQGVTFDQVRKNFFTDGCKAFGPASWCVRTPETAGRAMASSVLHDLFGDDVDGIAAMLDDAEGVWF